MRAFLVILVAFCVVGLAHNQVHATGVDTHRTIYNVTDAKNMQTVQYYCDRAHKNDGISEADCGKLQDLTGTEYLCASTAANAYCWVEYIGN